MKEKRRKGKRKPICEIYRSSLLSFLLSQNHHGSASVWEFSSSFVYGSAEALKPRWGAPWQSRCSRRHKDFAKHKVTHTHTAIGSLLSLSLSLSLALWVFTGLISWACLCYALEQHRIWFTWILASAKHVIKRKIKLWFLNRWNNMGNYKLCQLRD